jgi:hypothetical protein
MPLGQYQEIPQADPGGRVINPRVLTSPNLLSRKAASAMALCTVPSDRIRVTNSSTVGSAAAARLRTPIAICTTLKRPGSTRAPGNASRDTVGKVQILAIDVGLPCRKYLARRFEPTREWYNLGALDKTLQTA